TDAAMIHAIAGRYLEKPIGVTSAFARALRIILPLIGTWILMMLAICAPLMVGAIVGVALAVGPAGYLLLLPGAIVAFIFTIWYGLLSRVVVIEGITGPSALARSKRLMKGNFGTAVVLIIVLFLIVAMSGVAPRLIPLPEIQVIAQAILQAV